MSLPCCCTLSDWLDTVATWIAIGTVAVPVGLLAILLVLAGIDALGRALHHPGKE